MLAWRSQVTLLKLIGLSLHPEAECMLPPLHPAASFNMLLRVRPLHVFLQLSPPLVW